MKVVFMEDVPNVGKAGQIKEVADGYGKNFLIPHKLAMPAEPATAAATVAVSPCSLSNGT